MINDPISTYIQTTIREQIKYNEFQRKLDAEYLLQCRDMDESKRENGINDPNCSGWVYPRAGQIRYERSQSLYNRADWENHVLTYAKTPDGYLPSADDVIAFYADRYGIKGSN